VSRGIYSMFSYTGEARTIDQRKWKFSLVLSPYQIPSEINPQTYIDQEGKLYTGWSKRRSTLDVQHATPSAERLLRQPLFQNRLPQREQRVLASFFFFLQCHHMSLMEFMVSPPGCGRSVTDFWGWDAHEAQLRCTDEMDGDIWIWGTRRGLKPKFY
jgi:hypothetical protein